MRNLLVGALCLLSLGAAVWLVASVALRRPEGLRPDVASEANDETATKDTANGETARAIASDLAGGADKTSVAEQQPSAEFVSIFRNTQPHVKYVGDANCAQCHNELCESYHQHPMGRSAIVSGSDSLEQYDDNAKNPFKVGPYELSVVKDENGTRHRIAATLSDGTVLPPVEFPAQVTIGSGTRGRSYLHIDGDYVWQSPISWFSTSHRWDVSPGFDLGFATQRPIVSECLYCHVQSHNAVEDTVNKYREPIQASQLAIGCERCHGPGELHSEERVADTWKSSAQGDIDTSIVNPAHLSESLQMSICAQCHLSGKERVVRRGKKETEFRPGMPFEMFVTAFLAHPDAPFRNKAVSHFDQSALAKCRTSIGGPLLCTSCHDPHQSPEPTLAVSYYNQKCIDCHANQGCSAPIEKRQEKDDSCIACHMPQSASSNIPHTSLTDHRILRDPSAVEAKGNFSVSEIPLVAYSQVSLGDDDIERDLGIALSRFAGRQAPNSLFRKEALEKARAKLTKSLEKWRDDTDGWLALSETERLSGDMAAALTAAQNGLISAKSSEMLWAQVAMLADATNQPDLAFEALSQLLSRVPHSHEYLAKRMLTGVVLGNWDQAEADCRELLRINPVFPSAHLVLGMSLYGNGNKAEGRRQVEIASELATTPAQRASIQAYFDRFVAWRSQFE